MGGGGYRVDHQHLLIIFALQHVHHSRLFRHEVMQLFRVLLAALRGRAGWF
jgi:hypothetical protein